MFRVRGPKSTNSHTCRGPFVSFRIHKDSRFCFRKWGATVYRQIPGSRPRFGLFFSELTCTCQHCGEHSIQASAERRAFRLFLFKFVLGVVLSLLSRAVFVRLIMQWIVVICWVLAATRIACIGAVASRSCPCEFIGAPCFSAWHNRHLNADIFPSAYVSVVPRAVHLLHSSRYFKTQRDILS